MSGTAWHWLCWLLGAPAAVGGLWLIWFGLWGDRARGGRRCPQCWYDLSGGPALLCPECGRSARDEGDLKRSRRRWGLTVIGFVLVPAGYVGSVAPNLGQVGIRGFVPTTVLLLVPTPPPAPSTPRAFATNPVFRQSDPWFAELWRRHATGTMWDWQSRLLMRRDLARSIWCRDEWLAGQPLCIRLAPGWFESPTEQRTVRVTPRIDGSAPAELVLPPATPRGAVPAWPAGTPLPQALNTVAWPGSAWRDPARSDFPHTLAPVPAGTTDVTFDVEVTEAPAAGGPARVVFRGSVTKPLRTLDTPAEVMEPVDSPELTATIRAGLRVGVARGPGGPATLHGSMSIRDGIPPDLVTGMEIEFFYGDERVAWGRFRPMAWFSETSSGWVYGDMGRVADTITDPAWRVRVTGSIESSIRDPHGDRYWSGSFECPLSDVTGLRPVGP